MAQYYYERNGPSDYRVYSTSLSGGRGQSISLHSTAKAAKAAVNRLNREGNPSMKRKIVGVALNPSGKFLGFIDGGGRIRKGRVRRLRNPTPKGYSDAGISGYGKEELKSHIRAFREQGYLVRIQWVGGKWYLYTKRKK